MTKLFQYSHFLAVTHGAYDGELTIEELKNHGNYGLGTFNALDGELVVIDGHYYHCSGGKVRQANAAELLPWAAVANYQLTKPTQLINILNMDHLTQKLHTLFPSLNFPYLIYINAKCNNITLGSVPKQTKPYRPIADIIDSSIAIDTGNIQAKLVGFYAPDYMFPLKSSGLHLHFVDEDYSVGGHVLELSLAKAELYFTPLTSFEIKLPNNDFYKNVSLPLPKQDEKLPEFVDRLE